MKHLNQLGNCFISLGVVARCRSPGPAVSKEFENLCPEHLQSRLFTD